MGDIGCTSGIGGTGETGVSRIIASEHVLGEGGDGGVKAGGVLEGGVQGGGVSGIALPAGVGIGDGGIAGNPTAGSAGESDGAGIESGR
jgi:hypothetical protein